MNRERWALDDVLGTWLPTLDGLPVLVTEQIRNDEGGDGTSIYCLRFGLPWADPDDGGLVQFHEPELRVGAPRPLRPGPGPLRARHCVRPSS